MKNSISRLLFLSSILILIISVSIYFNSNSSTGLSTDNNQKHYTFKPLDFNNNIEIRKIQVKNKYVSLALAYSYNGSSGKNAILVIKPKFENPDNFDDSDRQETRVHITVGNHRKVIYLNKPCGELSKCKASEISMRIIKNQDFLTNSHDLRDVPSSFSKIFHKEISWNVDQEINSSLEQKSTTYSPEKNLLIAKSLISIGRYKIAKNILDKLILKQPRNIQAYLELARYHMKKSWNEIGLKRAEKIINTAYSFDKNNADTLTLRGYVYTHQRKYELAMKDFQKAKKIGSSNLWLDTNIGEWYQMNNNQAKALTYYKKVVNAKKFELSYKNEAKYIALDRAKKILLTKHDDLSVDNLMKTLSGQFPENGCFLSDWARFKLYHMGDFNKANQLAIESFSNGCDKSKQIKEVLSDSFISVWFLDSLSANGANSFNKAVSIDSNWAGRIYRFSTSNKLLAVLQKLLATKITIDEVDNNNLTALALASLDNNTNSVKKLLKMGANPNIIVDHDYTPFLISMMFSDPKTIKAFLDSKIPLNKVLSKELNASIIARNRGLHDIARQLGNKL